jgi:predicted nucleic acid-binding protein
MRIVYVDSSTVVRRYKPNEDGHADAAALFEQGDTSTVSSTLTYVEVSGALVRAGRELGIDAAELLARFDEDVRNGQPLLVAANQEEVEAIALAVARQHGIRALDALHIGAAKMIRDDLVGADDTFTFMSHDKSQAAAACALGLAAL